MKPKGKAKLPPPRNPLVAPSMMRKAGVHRESMKTIRQRQAASLKKLITESTDSKRHPKIPACDAFFYGFGK